MSLDKIVYRPGTFEDRLSRMPLPEENRETAEPAIPPPPAAAPKDGVQVVNFSQQDGRQTLTTSDGRTITEARNGVAKEEDHGALTLLLPNGIMLHRDASGNVKARDAQKRDIPGAKAEQRRKDGQYYFTFEHDGLRYMATSNTLGFEVQNATVTQQVKSTGAVDFLVRPPGADPADEAAVERFRLRADGKLEGAAIRNQRVRVEADKIVFTQSNQSIALPHPLPQLATTAPNLSAPGPGAVPQRNTAEPSVAPVVPTTVTPEPPVPPSITSSRGTSGGLGYRFPTQQAASSGQSTASQARQASPPTSEIRDRAVAGSNGPVPPPDPNQPVPPGPPLLPGQGPFNNYNQWGALPWMMTPFQPTPGAPGKPPGEYDPILTPDGLFRQASQDGSQVIVLPNVYIEVNILAGGNQVKIHDPILFDNNPKSGGFADGQVRDVVTNNGPEKEISFTDGRGNQWLMYSRSLDYVITNRDHTVQQTFLPQGNILVQAYTPAQHPDGTPYWKGHTVEILPNGAPMTYGEYGVRFRSLNTVGFTDPNGNYSEIELPVPIPEQQGLLSTLRAVQPQYPMLTSGLHDTPSMQNQGQPQAHRDTIAAPGFGGGSVAGGTNGVTPTQAPVPPMPAMANSSAGEVASSSAAAVTPTAAPLVPMPEVVSQPATSSVPPGAPTASTPAASGNAAVNGSLRTWDELSVRERNSIQATLDRISDANASPELINETRDLMLRMINGQGSKSDDLRFAEILQTVFGNPSLNTHHVETRTPPVNDNSNASTASSPVEEAPQATEQPAAEPPAAPLPPLTEQQQGQIDLAIAEFKPQPALEGPMRYLMGKMVTVGTSDDEKTYLDQLFEAAQRGDAQAPPPPAGVQVPSATASNPPSPTPAPLATPVTSATATASPQPAPTVEAPPALPDLTEQQKGEIDNLVASLNAPPDLAVPLRYMMQKLLTVGCSDVENTYIDQLVEAAEKGETKPPPPPEGVKVPLGPGNDGNHPVTEPHEDGPQNDGNQRDVPANDPRRGKAPPQMGRPHVATVEELNGIANGDPAAMRAADPRNGMGATPPGAGTPSPPPGAQTGPEPAGTNGGPTVLNDIPEPPPIFSGPNGSANAGNTWAGGQSYGPGGPNGPAPPGPQADPIGQGQSYDPRSRPAAYGPHKPSVFRRIWSMLNPHNWFSSWGGSAWGPAPSWMQQQQPNSWGGQNSWSAPPPPNVAGGAPQMRWDPNSNSWVPNGQNGQWQQGPQQWQQGPQQQWQQGPQQQWQQGPQQQWQQGPQQQWQQGYYGPQQGNMPGPGAPPPNWGGPQCMPGYPNQCYGGNPYYAQMEQFLQMQLALTTFTTALTAIPMMFYWTPFF
jgi:hypothetical protein